MRRWLRKVTASGVPLSWPEEVPFMRFDVEGTREHAKVPAHLDEEELDEIARRARAGTIEQLDPAGGSVLVLRGWDWDVTPELVDRIRTVVPDALVVDIGSMDRDAFEVLDEEAMRAHGWISVSAVTDYLDSAIRRWREVRRGERRFPDRTVTRTEVQEATAACYVDAFQSARASLVGELLLEEK